MEILVPDLKGNAINLFDTYNLHNFEEFAFILYCLNFFSVHKARYIEECKRSCTIVTGVCSKGGKSHANSGSAVVYAPSKGGENRVEINKRETHSPWKTILFRTKRTSQGCDWWLSPPILNVSTLKAGLKCLVLDLPGLDKA